METRQEDLFFPQELSAYQLTPCHGEIIRENYVQEIDGFSGVGQTFIASPIRF